MKISNIEHFPVRIRPGHDGEQHYECMGEYKSFSLPGLLMKMEKDGWELVGEVEGQIYVKRVTYK
jgi:hypothetical protein